MAMQIDIEHDDREQATRAESAWSERGNHSKISFHQNFSRP
jgi:hypothetical protein